MVSILMAAYNHERFIGQAIESVLAQTYPHWELLVWDDGSSDRTPEIALKYAERYPDRIRFFRHPGGANRGQENTRNAALEKARGRYLSLLDSDDYFLPRKLELLVPLLERSKRVGLAYGQFAEHRQADGQLVRPGVSGPFGGMVLRPLLAENFLSAAAVVFRRECLGEGMKFDSTFRTIGEYPLWLKIARDWEFAFTSERVSCWRDHGANLGTKLNAHGKRELVALFERLVLDPDFRDYAAEIDRALMARRYDYAADLYASGDFDGARNLLRRLVAEPGASARIQVKAELLLLALSLGERANVALSSWKRGRRARE